ncbi:sulfurtransferase TusA family protein [Hydrogenovibrio kuenenii]|uniref:sulfurtransferase TusA family protein n=1 Tax=Hydrogenovibrio kuenenii TaxID=63658 RepID=UPI0004631ACF|nr:sulfurtransferase TusA family protein [Hydrogenovibrio kuenenii]
MPSTTIDAKGLKCPMPVIKLQQAVRNATSGDHIAIECTDMGAEKDIGSWCKVNKHQLVSCIMGESKFKERLTPTLFITIEVK